MAGFTDTDQNSAAPNLQLPQTQSDSKKTSLDVMKINPLLAEKLSYDDIPETARWNYGTYVGDVRRDSSGNPIYAGKTGLLGRQSATQKADTALESKRKEQGLTEPGSFSFTRDGRTVNYGSHNIGPYANALKNGLFNMPLEEQFTMSPADYASAITDIPDFRTFYNNYWASIPQEDWDKAYVHATPEERQNYVWYNPARISYDDTDRKENNAVYMPLTGGVTTPKDNEQTERMLSKMRTPWYGFSEKKDGGGEFTGAANDRTTKLFDWRRRTPMDMLRLSIQGHEGNHANQLPIYSEQDIEDMKEYAKENGIPLDIVQNLQDKQFNKWKNIGLTFGNIGQADDINNTHPVLLPSLQAVKPYANSYVANQPEEAQAVKSFKTSLLGLQNLARRSDPQTMGLTADEYENLLKLNPLFRSKEEMENTMDWLRSHPHVGLMLGTEGTRALDIADEYALRTKFIAGTDGKMTWDDFNKIYDTYKPGGSTPYVNDLPKDVAARIKSSELNRQINEISEQLDKYGLMDRIKKGKEIEELGARLRLLMLQRDAVNKALHDWYLRRPTPYDDENKDYYFSPRPMGTYDLENWKDKKNSFYNLYMSNLNKLNSEGNA